MLLILCSHIISDDVPEMSQLTELKIPEKPFTVRIIEDIGMDYTSLGTCLLNDKVGSKLREIENDYHRTEKIVNEIFHQWIKGKGQVDGKKSNTWRRLIQCLKTARLMVLVDKIDSALCEEENKPKVLQTEEPSKNLNGIHQTLGMYTLVPLYYDYSYTAKMSTISKFDMHRLLHYIRRLSYRLYMVHTNCISCSSWSTLTIHCSCQTIEHCRAHTPYLCAEYVSICTVQSFDLYQP